MKTSGWKGEAEEVGGGEKEFKGNKDFLEKLMGKAGRVEKGKGEGAENSQNR